MHDNDEAPDHARRVFAGMTPRVAEPSAATGRSMIGKGMLATVPIVLASTLTVTGAIAPLDTDASDKKGSAKPKSSLGSTVRAAIAAKATPASSVPSTYTVKAGDTVASIATRYGLATASVLAVNGLGWKSLIFPGQVLKLTSGAVAATPKPALAATPASSTSSSGRYTIQKGDTISRIASRFGVSTQAILSANGLSWSSIIYPGQTVAIPGGTLNATPVSSVTPGAKPAPAAPSAGSSYTIVSGDTISGIASRFGLSTSSLLAANNLTSSSIIYPGQKITIPGTTLAATPVSSVTAAPAKPAAPSATSSYTIVRGDTLSSIAKKFGVSIQTILDANGLSWSSMIYAGRALTIPGGTNAPATSGVTPLTSEMGANARVIIQVGRDLGVSDRGIIIALATAMQESSLRNINYGDRDSLGLFQQRPSQGWGTASEVQDAEHASRLFYGGPSNPNAGVTRGLLDIRGWESMSLTRAAQAVQISAYPDHYAKWETSATAWLAQLG